MARSLRNAFRRFVPKRARWLIRVALRLLSGFYVKRALADRRDLSERVASQSTELEAQSEVLYLLLRRMRTLEAAVDRFEYKLVALGESVRRSEADAVKRDADLHRLVRFLAPAASSTSVFWGAPSAETGENELVMSKALSDFYIQFQNRHRGSEELIRERQRGRVPYFQSCRRVLDIGCGRGELLELLQERQIAAEGIDLSESAIDACLSKGLSVTHAEALAFLASTGEGTFDGVHMSHVLEHMPFSSAVQLLEACALQIPPGGVLVAETPNPHSPEALQAFFLDPTHVRPLFPEALVILLESLGFADVKAHFLNPVRQANGTDAAPGDFADYLVVAVKALQGATPSNVARGQRSKQQRGSTIPS